jgi:hypothetical protein
MSFQPPKRSTAIEHYSCQLPNVHDSGLPMRTRWPRTQPPKREQSSRREDFTERQSASHEVADPGILGVSFAPSLPIDGSVGDKSDDLFAAELLGTDVLVGVTLVDHSGRVTERRQFHAKVVHASVKDGVTLIDADGDEHWLPLNREAYEPAEPGEYELRSTGQVVVDPTWLTKWIVTPPSQH